MSTTTQTITVAHLGGITASYRLSPSFTASKPTLVLVNSFLTSAALFDSFFANDALTSRMNLLAIELLGHGQTRAHEAEHWTYWDTAVMNLQVMEALGVQRAFVMGTSQGGWVTVRMALLGGKKVCFLSLFFSMYGSFNTLLRCSFEGVGKIWGRGWKKRKM